jgi:surface protein
MQSMFGYADSFNCDLSKWNVSSVTTMDYMFYVAGSFNKVLCGNSWIESSASKYLMFGGDPLGPRPASKSKGSIGACSSSDGLSGGAFAGIVIGVLPGLGLCIGAAAYTALKLKRRKSTLTEAVLTEALFTEAELTEAVRTETVFAEAVFAEAVFAEAVLTEAVLTEAVLTEAFLRVFEAFLRVLHAGWHQSNVSSV